MIKCVFKLNKIISKASILNSFPTPKFNIWTHFYGKYKNGPSVHVCQKEVTKSTNHGYCSGSQPAAQLACSPCDIISTYK